eukprot:7386757-Prymnesium_polylepis.1
MQRARETPVQHEIVSPNLPPLLSKEEKMEREKIAAADPQHPRYKIAVGVLERMESNRRKCETLQNEGQKQTLPTAEPIPARPCTSIVDVQSDESCGEEDNSYDKGWNDDCYNQNDYFE